MKSPASPKLERSSRSILQDVPPMLSRRGICTKGRLTGFLFLKARFLLPSIAQRGNTSGNSHSMKPQNKPSRSRRTYGTDSLLSGEAMQKFLTASLRSTMVWTSIVCLWILFPATGNLKADEKLFISPEKKPLKVRLTTYHRNEDYWTSRLKSASGYTLKEGVSVATDPKLFPYGTKIYIEGVGIRQVHDTGTAVISRKASRGKLPIVDIFFLREKCAEAFANSHRYARVWIVQNNTSK